MSDELQPQNSISEENSLPTSPQEPIEPAPINTAYSVTSTMPPEAPESPQNTESAIPVNNDNSAQNKHEAIKPELGEIQKMPENRVSTEQQTAQMAGNEPFGEKEEKPKLSYIKSQKLTELLEKAKNVIQFRKRKKLEKIMALFLQQSKITNDEVEKYLRVSDATATRYLEILEKENKIKQVGKTGKAVSYSRI